MNGFPWLLSRIIATILFIGYIPFAPGTLGSFAALMFVWLMKPGALLSGVLIFIFFVLGTITSHIAESSLGRDSGRIVIDEFTGCLISVFLLPITAGYLIAAFFLFRFFDILKPPPIRHIENSVLGGLGVMLDDMAAGLMTNLLLQIWRMIA